MSPYAGRAEGVFVAFDGIANDGGDGEYDDLGSPEQFDNIIGGNGDDLLVGGAQANIIDGSGGDDLLLGAAGADALHGGAGDADIVSYEDRDAAVNAALNNQPTAGNAADGPVGARDTIGGDVEGLFGGAGNDILSGNGASNLLSGGPGADVLSGKDGDDAADYSERASGVTVAPDGTSTSGNADDGPEGSRDRVLSDIEVLFGGAGVAPGAARACAVAPVLLVDDDATTARHGGLPLLNEQRSAAAVPSPPKGVPAGTAGTLLRGRGRPPAR